MGIRELKDKLLLFQIDLYYAALINSFIEVLITAL